MTVCPKCKFYNICKGRINETVENCVRFKSVEQTNEEWFISLSTEEKAKWIATQCNNAVMESTYDVSQLRKKRYWEEWLKEIHND